MENVSRLRVQWSERNPFADDRKSAEFGGNPPRIQPGPGLSGLRKILHRIVIHYGQINRDRDAAFRQIGRRFRARIRDLRSYSGKTTPFFSNRQPYTRRSEVATTAKAFLARS